MTRFVGTPLRGTEFSSASDEAVSTRVNGDTQARIRIDAGGRITWGSGTTSGDVNLYRDSANVLKTDDTFKTPSLFVDGIEIDTTGATSSQVLSFDGTKFSPATISTGGLTISTYVATGRLNSDQTIPTGSDTLISFIDDSDPNGWWDATTKRFTPNIAGYYAISFSAWWSTGSASTNQFNTQARKNGNTFAIYMSQMTTSTGQTQGGTKIVYLNGTTDYVDFTAYNGDSSSRTLQYGGSTGQGTHFSAALLTAGKGDKGDTGDTGATGPAGADGATTLDALTDVTITSATSGQVLKYNGSAWVNGTDNAGTSINYLDDIGDVTITSAAAGDIISWNGSAWVNIGNYAEATKHYVKNDTGGSLAVGSAVYTYGANGTNILVRKAQANAESTSATILGIMAETLATNGIGFVVTQGLVAGFNTSSATAGDPVWLSPTTAGGLVYGTGNKPSAPNHLVYIGVVTRAHAVNGEIFVNISNGWELEELHNVAITSAASGDFLKYDGTNWVNDPINLSTDTVGSYVASLVAGTGITLANNSGEGATPTISIGQDVATTSSVTFGSIQTAEIIQPSTTLSIGMAPCTVTVDGTLSVTGAIEGVLSVATRAIIFEGDTADAYETEIYAAEPTADRTITFPNKSGTVAIDGSVAIGVSDTAPSSPSTGQLWYESDTGATFVYEGSAWVEVGATQGPYVCTSTTRPSSPYEGQLIYETDTDKVMTYNGSSWLYMLKPQATEPGAWTTYTPTNSGITVGNGTQTARYTRIGKTIHVSYRLVLGSTSSFSGDIRVGMPSTCNSSATCVVICTDAGIATYTAMGNMEPTDTKILIRPINVGGTFGGWDNTLSGAFTWNTNDVMQFSVTYEES